MTEIEADASRTLKSLAEWSQGDRDEQQGRYSLEGEEITQGTELDAERINDAVELLELNGYVSVARFTGSAPYSFSSVQLSAAGRLEYQRATAASKPQPRIQDMPEPDKKKVF